jgi:hypothetical protein
MDSLAILCAALTLGQTPPSAPVAAGALESTPLPLPPFNLDPKLEPADVNQASFSSYDLPLFGAADIIGLAPGTRTEPGGRGPGMGPLIEKEAKAAGETAPPRRGLPAPLNSPPFPSADYFGSPPLIGIPAGAPSYPLMRALQGTWYGNALNNSRINVYGWLDGGGNLSSSKNSNVPLSYNIVPNSVQLDQAIFRIERVPDSVQTDSMDWGFRLTNLYGIDYRYTTAKGYFSDQLLKHNNLYGYDPLEIYGLLYVPWVAQGMIIKVGRYISPPDIEAQLAPDNYLYSHSVMYTYDPYTFTGFLSQVKLNDQWVIYIGFHFGNDIAPWTTSRQPNGLVEFRWVSKDNNDAVLAGVNSIGDGRFKNFHDNLQMVVATWTHRFKDRIHTATEAYYIWQRDALMGGTVIEGPPKPFFEAVGPGPLIPGISPDVGAVNYTLFQLSPRDYFTVRNDILDDIKGERTGFISLYSEHTLGWAHYFSPNLLARPEIRYERSYNTPAYDNGTRKNQFTIAADVIGRF